MLDHRPGDRESVEGGGAAAHLVQNDQAPGRGRVQDDGRLGHLHHEGGPAPGQVVGGPDSGEDPVHDGQLGLLSRNEGAHLGHDREERRLAEIGGLAPHVGPGDDEDLIGALIQIEVVGNEPAGGQLLGQTLDDRVPPPFDRQLLAGVEAGVSRNRTDGRRRPGSPGNPVGPGRGPCCGCAGTPGPRRPGGGRRAHTPAPPGAPRPPAPGVRTPSVGGW